MDLGDGKNLQNIGSNIQFDFVMFFLIILFLLVFLCLIFSSYLLNWRLTGKSTSFFIIPF